MNFKRVLRELKENLLKNISFALLMMLSVMVIVGFNRGMDSYIASVDRFYETHHVEDGEFMVLGSLTTKQRLSMQRHFDLVIEENKFIDYKLSETQKINKSSQIKKDVDVILRITCVDRVINQLALLEGVMPKHADEVLLDPKFAHANDYKIGETIVLYDNSFHIVGYGITPDYVNTLKNLSDFLASPHTFGVAYVNQKGFDKVDQKQSKTTLYSYEIKNQGHNGDELKEYLIDHTALLDFTEKQFNARIQTVYDDANGPKQMALIIGVLLVIIITFIISISIQNTLKSESQTIGILYGQGFVKKEFIRYYIILPTLLISLGTLLGYIGGILISNPILLIEDAQYTVPNVILKDSWYLVLVGIVLPIILSLTITYFYLSKALGKTPLSLLSGEHSNMKVSGLEKRFTFKGISFFTRFRLKNILREKGSMLALLFGSLLSMMLLTTSSYVRDSCDHFIDEVNSKLPFNYLYTFVDAKQLSKYSQKGERTTIKNVKVKINHSKKSFVIQGLAPNSEFYNIAGIENLEANEVYIAPSLLIKFNLDIGDSLTLIDDLEDKEYSIIIKGTAPYDYGQYLYTNIQSFNKLFGIHKQSYNALVTHEKLDIPEEKISSLISKEEMVGGITNLLNLVSVMSYIILIASVAIFITVIYMLLNMMIAKVKVNISMVKIFGYEPREINNLYLRGTYIILVFSFICGVPLGYAITKILFDSIMINMQQYILPHINTKSILMSFVVMTISYGVIIHLLKRSLDSVSLTEALKNRE